jgi:hypothetical protein
VPRASTLPKPCKKPQVPLVPRGYIHCRRSLVRFQRTPWPSNLPGGTQGIKQEGTKETSHRKRGWYFRRNTSQRRPAPPPRVRHLQSIPEGCHLNRWASMSPSTTGARGGTAPFPPTLAARNRAIAPAAAPLAVLSTSKTNGGPDQYRRLRGDVGASARRSATASDVCGERHARTPPSAYQATYPNSVGWVPACTSQPRRGWDRAGVETVTLASAKTLLILEVVPTDAGGVKP